MHYFKQNWPHLLLSLFGTTFALGIAWSTLGNRVANAERRLDEINLSHVSQTRWQVDQDTATLATLRADTRETQAAVAQINTHLGVIDTKLDSIAEELKHR